MSEQQDVQAALYLAEPNIVKDDFKAFESMLHSLDLKAILALQVVLAQRALSLQMTKTTVLHKKLIL